MTGVVTLSLELELGWGMHDLQEYSHLSENREKETEALKRLLSLSEKHEIPITFDVVGHLLHDSCSGSHPGPHSDGWWEEDPGTDDKSHPHFYAPDLVSLIQTQEVDHELATHTYSHILNDEASLQQLDDELTKVKAVHGKFGIPRPKSIVTPRHQLSDYSILSKHGIEVIRRPIEGYAPTFSNPISKAWWLLTRDHPMSELQTREGILETTVTSHPSLTSVTLPNGQSSPHPVFSTIPRQARRSLHQRYLINAIDRAAAEDSHLHLWTHVYNMANDDQWAPIQTALSHLATQRDNGDIVVKPMVGLQGEFK